MQETILKMAASQGLWATLAVGLIFYILKVQENRDLKQEEREKNYQEIITNLMNKFEILQDVKNDLQEIKAKISKR